MNSNDSSEAETGAAAADRAGASAEAGAGAGVGAGYALGQLARALATASGHDEPGARARAADRAGRWRSVIAGMVSGKLKIGSRTPVADLPAWATPVVLHGGFVDGSAAAEGPLLRHEIELARAAEEAAAAGGRGSTAAGTPDVAAGRRAVFAYMLTDAGRQWLTNLLDGGRYRLKLPEEAALPVVAWLVRAGEPDKALEVAEAIAPWAGRLRFTPAPTPDTAPADEPITAVAGDVTETVVWRRTAGEAKADLDSRGPNARIEAMREALTVWNPFADELLQLWLDAIGPAITPIAAGAAPAGDGAAGGRARAGDAPAGDAPTGDAPAAGGAALPAIVVDAAWRERAAALLARYRTLAAEHTCCSKHRKPKENLAILRRALEEIQAGEVSPRTRGLLRHAVSAMVRKRGEPGSPAHRELRQGQAAAATAKTHLEFAREVAGRLAVLPADRGVADIGSAVGGAPEPVARLVRRAWAAPVRELVRAGVVPSAEVMAELMPPVTASVTSAAYRDPALQRLMAATYRAFRNRRSVLLLDLAQQVRIEELPWVAAVERHRSSDHVDTSRAAVAGFGGLALDGFPGTTLPNPLIQELTTLSRAAGDTTPWVEELASDIFMGTFSAKFLRAAQIAAGLLQGSLYERYYGIDYAAVAAIDDVRKGRYGAATSPRFDQLCAERAQRRPGSSVAANGMVIEQAQILTTHNLATLVAVAGVTPRAGWADLAERAFAEVVTLIGRAERQPWSLATIKNAAFAWRAMIFFATMADADRTFVSRLEGSAKKEMLRPALAGLAHAVGGGTFAPDGTAVDGGGRRFLGWSVGKHWIIR